MNLVFDLVKSGESIPKEHNFRFNTDGGHIGRNDDSSWVLSDPKNYISGVHARIEYRNDTYCLIDESTNGTFLKFPYKKLPKGKPVPIKASDIFIIGDHEVQARFSHNDFDEDDIVGHYKEDISLEELIPNDDFLFESPDSGFDMVIKRENKKITDDILDLVAKEPTTSKKKSNEMSQEKIYDKDLYREEGLDHLEDPMDAPRFSAPLPTPKLHATQTQTAREGLEKAFDTLALKLGLNIENMGDEELNEMMSEVGDVVVNVLSKLQYSIKIKNRMQQDMHLDTHLVSGDESNPLRMGLKATKLLQSKQHRDMLGMMKLSDAISDSLEEINHHSIALHGSTKRMMNIAASRFAPKNLEYSLASRGFMKKFVPKRLFLWGAYTQMFDKLNSVPDAGEEMLSRDYKNEYEKLFKSLSLTKNI